MTKRRTSVCLWGLAFIIYCLWSIGRGFVALASTQTNAVLAHTGIEAANDLIQAALDGDSLKLCLLLSNGCDANARIGPGLTAWQAARIKGRTNIMDLVAKRGVDTNASPPGPEAILDWYVRQRVGTESPGLALAVIRDGHLIFQRGWGLANLEDDIPITPATVFHVASVSKQFTALAIALLMQRGKLSPQDDIRKYLPQMHDYGAKITVGHLLSHTSGLRDQWTLLALAGKHKGDIVSQPEVVKLLEQQQELLFNPGEEFMYCNSGYTLLAEIAAKVSGKSFGDFTHEIIFDPLGMTNSHFHTNSQEVVKHMAYGYYLSPEGGYRKDPLNYETVGATGLYTTVEDLAKWIANFEHPKAWNAAPLALMQQPGRLNSGEKIDYGMGLFLEQYRGARLIQHGGADASYRSFVLWFPELRLGVALLGNLASLDTREIALTAAELYLVDKLQPVKEATTKAQWPSLHLSAAELDRYVGKYELYWRLTEVVRVQDHLEIREDNDPPLELISNGNGRFSAGPRWFVFTSPESDAALEFTDEWKEHFKRINAPEESQPDLNTYAGDYWSNELETSLRIRLRDRQLVLQLQHQGEFPMRPVARNIFASAGRQYWWLEVKFQRDPKDALTGLRLNGILFQRGHLQ